LNTSINIDRFTDNRMAMTRTKIIPGLRLLFATLVLLFNSVAPVAKLLRPEKVTCGMACCLESGACYCNSGSHSRSGEQSHDHSEEEKSKDGIDAPPLVEIASLFVWFQDRHGAVAGLVLTRHHRPVVNASSLRLVLLQKEARFAGADDVHVAIAIHVAYYDLQTAAGLAAMA
jgi:hypothetical protein